MQSAKGKPALALHGGAGTIRRQDMSAEDAREHTDALRAALDAGWTRLEHGDSALDAVEATVRVLEDCPLFNAGRGSVLNAAGEVEMDAAMMWGKTCAAGAVAGIQGVRNPVTLARHILEDQRFVFLAGHGAEAYARELGLPFEAADYFIIPRRREQLLRAQQSDSMALDHEAKPEKFGTVGAVALDKDGNLAAATSTGGLTNKRFGRVGDSPLIGAGTYADNRGAAISCTGYGEAFIRTVVAHSIAARIRLLGQSLVDATSDVMRDLESIHGQGGFVSVDAAGNICMRFNTDGMYRAYRTGDGDYIGLYRD